MEKTAIDFEDKITVIVQALSEAGYDPYTQLYGFLETGDATYITRRSEARQLIQSIDRKQLHRYIEKIKP